jgi:hypothetical protein
MIGGVGHGIGFAVTSIANLIQGVKTITIIKTTIIPAIAFRFNSFLLLPQLCMFHHPKEETPHS